MRRLSPEDISRFIEGARKVAILAIGNPLRRDDAAGYILGKKLRGKLNADVYVSESTPENYLFRIIDRGYSHIIIVDSVLVDGTPGTLLVINRDEISEYLFLTHSIPLKFIIDFLVNNNIKVFVVGIIPKDIDIGEEVSTEVKNAVDRLAKIFVSLFGK